MKKLLAIPLLLLYLVAVSGTMVQLHYCGSRLSSWNLNEAKASCCCSDDKSPVAHKQASLSDDDCCSSKVITLKIAQDQNRAHAAVFALDGLQVVLPVRYISAPVMAIPEVPVQMAYRANAPPGLWQDIPLYKLHSRFTYYG